MPCSESCAACQKEPKEQTLVEASSTFIKVYLGKQNCREAKITTHPLCSHLHTALALESRHRCMLEVLVQ